MLGNTVNARICEELFEQKLFKNMKKKIKCNKPKKNPSNHGNIFIITFPCGLNMLRLLY